VVAHTRGYPGQARPGHMVRDAQIYVVAAQRALEDAVLPLDYRAAVAEAKSTLTAYSTEAQGRFDLAPVFGLLEELGAAVEKLERRFAPRRSRRGGRVGQLLPDGARPGAHPIDYCRSGPFEHDTTLPSALPRMEPMRRLGTLRRRAIRRASSRWVLCVSGNKVCYHLSNALATTQATLAALPSAGRRRSSGVPRVMRGGVHVRSGMPAGNPAVGGNVVTHG